MTDLAHPLDLSTLPEGVSATFTSSCIYGCVVRTVDGQEEPHVCVGEQVIAALAPELAFDVVRRIAGGLAPLLRELSHDTWVDGVRSGRTGPCYGVPEDGEVRDGELPAAIRELVTARGWTKSCC